MKYTFSPIEDLSSAKNLIVFVDKEKKLSPRAADLDTSMAGFLGKMIKTLDFKGEFLDFQRISADKGGIESVFLVGVGDTTELSQKTLYQLGGKVAQNLRAAKVKDIHVLADSLDGNEQVPHFVLGLYSGNYAFDKYFTKNKDKKVYKLENLVIYTTDVDGASKHTQTIDALQKAIYYTRDIVSEPGNIVNPESLAQMLQSLTSVGLEIEVLNEADMRKLGMGSLLSVGNGSEKESHLVVMKWYGAASKDEQPISFVGKGVTFDTGGISIKPANGMEDMKWDMGGAAAVIGTMHALAGRKANVNAIGVVGLVENMPSGSATRPGDVVTSMSGQTIEVINTDAEGRLVLADAIWYCQENYKPKFLIDLATLTGAIIISLGYEYAGCFSDDETLIKQLKESGEKSGEEVWHLPLGKNYDKLIDSQIADMKNVGERGAGSITAAQFLKRFVKEETPWVHLDIAGTAWEYTDRPQHPKGANGYGVLLLNQLVKDHYEN